MSLTGPARGLRLMHLGVLLMLTSYVLEVVLAITWVRADDVDSVISALAWTGRLHLLVLGALMLLLIGVVSQVGTLRRRRLSLTAAVVALVALVATIFLRSWLFDLMGDAVTALRGDDLESIEMPDLELVPQRVFFATVAYAIALIAIVRTLRQYALADGHLAMREQARHLAGMLVLLLLADTAFRFSYGLGSGGFGLVGLMAAIGVGVFWFWCHRLLRSLVEHAAYEIGRGESIPRAQIVLPVAPVAATVATAVAVPVAPAPQPAPAPAPAPAREPMPAPAPAVSSEPATSSDDGGPRFLR